MRPYVFGFIMAVAACVLGVPAPALADEADNFTCRALLKRDSRAALDALMNARIQEAIDRSNHHRRGACGADCLFRELRKGIGGSVPEPVTLIPHARFERWIRDQTGVDRCHLKFSETIYGAHPYNLPWLLPLYGRIVFVADSILLSGHVVGIDKISHFIREGRDFWRDVTEYHRDIASVLREDLGPPRWQLGWNEFGLKGMSLTGVLSYADLAASYFGFRFWTDLFSLGRPESFVAVDPSIQRFTQIRPFTFADYVNEAWDEGVNYSVLAPELDKEVAAALERRSLSRSIAACRSLASLPDAHLYVNPACLGASLSDKPLSVAFPGPVLRDSRLSAISG